jgi:peptide/nickel transport system ATP-binding protein
VSGFLAEQSPETSPGTTDRTAAEADGDQFLVVDHLSVKFPTHDGLVQAVSDLSYTVKRGETLGIVGESGSGKSVSSMAVLGLHDPKQARLEGSIRVGGTEVIGADHDTMQRLRGNEVAMIFQDPLTALHPFYSVGRQISEAYLVHHKVSRSDARKRAIEMLDRVGIPQAKSRVDDYPHQFSGGMRQRAMIAMSLVNDPKLLIADEPTTALDVTVQAQILDLLQDLQREFHSAIIMITHDLGVIAEMADEVLVMYGGRAVETGPTKLILTHPEMPYTWGLLSSVPEVTSDTEARLIPIPGNPPSLLNPPTGCPFHPRCTYKDQVPGDLCTTTLPPLAPAEVGNDHLRRCHLPDAGAIYATEILPEIAPDLVDPETGQPIAELQAVIDEVSAPSATADLADESAGNEELLEQTREDGAR